MGSITTDSSKKRVRLRRTLAQLINWWWGGQVPGLFLPTAALLVALLMTIPALYVFLQGLDAGVDRWASLLDGRIPALLLDTVTLVAVVTLAATALGVTLAWLVTRSDLPGRQFWRWLLALPLAVPPYIGAISHLMIWGPRGYAASLMRSLGLSIYSFAGTAFVLTIFTYPYIYLLTIAALQGINRSYEEAGRSLGLNSWQLFRRITLPMLRPSIGAGAILVALYVLSDFGTVSIMRYNTFTTAIYYQIGSFEQRTAAILSVVLTVIAFLLLWWERVTKARQRFVQVKGGVGRPEQIPLGRLQPLAFAYTILVFLLAVGLPIGILGYWGVQGLQQGALDARFFRFLSNSFILSALASLISMILAVPVVYLKVRFPARASNLFEQLSYTGYVLPGLIPALGLIFIFNNYLPLFYGTAVVLIVAYIIRFLPQSMQATEAALSALSPSLEEAGRSLGLKPFGVLKRITLPIVMPGIVAGGALVFVNALKELPATLLLRPAGYDTLAVRIWIEASEGFYASAAPAAVLIILLSLLPLRWLLARY